MSRTPTRFSGRSLPAALLAVVVLLVAMAGSATAAKLITSKQIKNNTITSQDVKNGALTGADVKNSSIASADVKNGSVGAADLNASAKNEVRSQRNEGQQLLTCGDTALDDCAPIVNFPVGGGTWLVTATYRLDNFVGPATSLAETCGLQLNNDDTLDEARVPLAANGSPGEAAAVTLQAVVKTPGLVGLKCTEFPGETLTVSGAQLSALKVG